MKNITYRITLFLVDAVYALTFISLILGVLLFSYKVWQGESYNFNIGEFRPQEVGQQSFNGEPLEILNTTLQDATLVARIWHVRVETNDRMILILLYSLALAYWGYLLYIIHLLRQFIYSIKNDSIFSLLNVNRIRIIGFLVIAVYPLRVLLRILSSRWLNDSVNMMDTDIADGYSLGYWLGANMADLSFINNWLFVGFIILAIGEVLKKGVQMKEEQELTI